MGLLVVGVDQGEVRDGEPVREHGQCAPAGAAEDAAVELLAPVGQVVGDRDVGGIAGLAPQHGSGGHGAPQPDDLPVFTGGDHDLHRVGAAGGGADGRGDARDISGAVEGDAHPSPHLLVPGVGAGMSRHRLRHLVDGVEGVGVVIGGLEGGAGVVLASPDVVEAVVAGVDPRVGVLGDDGVLALLVDAALHEELGGAAGHRAVLRLAVQMVVVQVARGDVVDAAVALVGVPEPAVVHRQRGHDVVGPAHPERLVVVAEDRPGDGHRGRVLADVDLTVTEPHELAVIDPHVIGGVHPDPVMIVVLAVPVTGHVGVAQREIAEDHIAHVLELEAAADDLGIAADAGDRGVRGDRERGAEGLDGDAAVHEHDRRLGPGDRLRECVRGGHDDVVAAETADGAVGKRLTGNAREAGRQR